MPSQILIANGMVTRDGHGESKHKFVFHDVEHLAGLVALGC